MSDVADLYQTACVVLVTRLHRVIPLHGGHVGGVAFVAELGLPVRASGWKYKISFIFII